MTAVGSAARETATSLRTVARNPGLRNVNLAFGGSMVGDWAYATAVTVWAYEFGGVTAVGVWAVVRLGLLAIVTPFASAMADRYARTRVMITSDLIRASLVVVAAAAVFWDWPALIVFVLATGAAVAGGPFRPAQLALLPSLATRPAELTAANAVASVLESLAFFIGPALGGLLITVVDIPAVFLLNAATFFGSAALVSRVRLRADTADRLDADTAAAPGREQRHDGRAPRRPGAFFGQAFAGFGLIWSHHDLRLVCGLYCAQTVVSGASAVFLVAISVDLLGMGPEGVGYLGSVMGVGALVGGLAAVARSGYQRLATDFGAGVALWSLPLLLIVVWPELGVAIAALTLLGAANPIADVNGSTILQRLTPDPVMGRVFGALESALMATMALGSLLMPVLIVLIGLRGGLAAIAVGVGLLVVLAFRRLRRLDARLGPPQGLALIRSTTVFAPLSPAVLESLARRAVVVRAPAGRAIVREGEPGNRFYVIESGRVRVVRGERMLREEGPGEAFGEIALLRDVARTATVFALEDTVLRAVEREDFLAAVTGNADAQRAAEDVVALRLPI